MQNLFLVILCFILGQVFRRSGKFPENTPQAINPFILNVSLPSLVLLHIHNLPFQKEFFLLALMPWLVFCFGIIFFYAMYKISLVSKPVMACLVLTAGLGNTSFVGFPILEAYLGKTSLGLGMIVDQPGTFLTLSILGMAFLSLAHRSFKTKKEIFKDIFFFPPILCLLIALLSRPFDYPSWLELVLTRLGETLAPLALFSVGFLLQFRTLKGYWKPLLLGLGFKLFLVPLLVWFSFSPFFEKSSLSFSVLVMEASMAPMITSSMLAIEKNLSPHLAGLMLGIGIPISFFTTFFWFWLLQNKSIMGSL